MKIFHVLFCCWVLLNYSTLSTDEIAVQKLLIKFVVWIFKFQIRLWQSGFFFEKHLVHVHHFQKGEEKNWKFPGEKNSKLKTGNKNLSQMRSFSFLNDYIGVDFWYFFLFIIFIIDRSHKLDYYDLPQLTCSFRYERDFQNNFQILYFRLYYPCMYHKWQY